MSYLYNKVQNKIEELIKKNPKMELDMEYLKRNLPSQIKLTRYDVINVVREMEKDNIFKVNKNKLRKVI